MYLPSFLECTILYFGGTGAIISTRDYFLEMCETDICWKRAHQQHETDIYMRRVVLLDTVWIARNSLIYTQQCEIQHNVHIGIT